MNSDTNDEDSDDALANRLVLGLAAHPLNSCNPPPPELPDLLDSLIASEARLEEQVTVIDKVGQGLCRRIQDIQKRVLQLRSANSHLRKDTDPIDTASDDELLTQHRIFEAKDRVLSKMWIQVIFIHTMFTQKIKGMTISTIKAHRDIFAEFLGERHNHSGIQVANSSTLSCTPECDWYRKHGPYEWSKKPYSNAWLEEMNHTDWDWLRMKEHFATAVTVGAGKVITMYQMLQANSMTYVPGWFWSEAFDTWTLHGEEETVEMPDGNAERQIIIKVRFNRSESEMQQEEVKKQKEMVKSRLPDTTNPVDDSVIEIEKVGEMVIDKTFVFDELASKSAFNQPGQANVRWLTWWGFEKWHAEIVKKRAQKPQAR